MKAALSWSVAAAAIVVVQPAQAAAVRVESSVDRPTVGRGDVVEYSVTASVADAELDVSQVSPGSIDGFTLLGQMSQPHRSIVSRNGAVERRTSLTVVFQLRADKIGSHQLGPARITVGGRPMETKTVAVEVVAAGQAPRRRAPAPFLSPFPSPFNDPFADLFGDDDSPFRQPPPPDAPPPDPMAHLDALPPEAAGKDLFLRVAPSQTTPVVGAQLTVKVYAYARKLVPVTVQRVPTLDGCHVVDLGQPDEQWHPLTIAGERWHYASVKAYACFPLTTGQLTIGEAELSTPGRRRRGPDEYRSAPVTFTAVEPPPQGRPAGYVLGDVVSDLRLRADVVPRSIRDGHALVTLELEGEGRLDRLRPQLPVTSGFTWTATGDETHPRVQDLVVSGRRTMRFDVRIERTGDVLLGDVNLPVWDPRAQTYRTATASLGTVHVDAPAPSPSASAPTGSSLPPPRVELGPRGEGNALADRRWPWAVSFGLPLSVVLARGVERLVRRAGERMRRKREAPETIIAQDIAEAKAAEARGDARGASAAATRALERALENTTSLRARGLTRAELAAELEHSSLSPVLRGSVIEVLQNLEAARFAGDRPPSVSEIERLVSSLLNQ